MTSLDDHFLKPITIANEELGNEYMAYKMDDTTKHSDMRKMVNLGTCHCCDYFMIKDDHILLIEETQLLGTVNSIREKYYYLNEADQNKAVNDGITAEMQLKAYGSMLVLSRLAIKCPNVKKLFENKTCNLWVVASILEPEEGEPNDDKIYFDSLQGGLLGDLKSVLGGTLLDKVDVFTSDTLKERFR